MDKDVSPTPQRVWYSWHLPPCYLLSAGITSDLQELQLEVLRKAEFPGLHVGRQQA